MFRLDPILVEQLIKLDSIRKMPANGAKRFGVEREDDKCVAGMMPLPWPMVGHPQIVPMENETVETEQIMYRIFRFIGTMLLVVMDLLL